MRPPSLGRRHGSAGGHEGPPEGMRMQCMALQHISLNARVRCRVRQILPSKTVRNFQRSCLSPCRTSSIIGLFLTGKGKRISFPGRGLMYSRAYQ